MNSRRLTRSRSVAAFRLLAASLALFAQLGIATAAVLDEGNGANTAAHLESSGTNLHFAHNEADCFMCRAQHIGGSTPIAPSQQTVSAEASIPTPASTDGDLTAVAASTQQSRAPPRAA